MDKYEFNIKVEQIKKLMNRKDYATAMKIADSIDWRRVRNVKLLTMIAQVYEYNEEYREAKDILLMAYERAPIGKRLLYKLTELAIKEGKLAEAEAYFREFRDLAPNDPRQYLLRYMISNAKGLEPANLIPFLEAYKEYDFDERWSYELAELYHLAGRVEDCVRLCDEIILWFSLGDYVEKAMELKRIYRPLTERQMELLENKAKYEEKLREIEREFAQTGGVRGSEEDEEPSEPSQPSAPIDEEMVARMTEADTEKRLAEEMSRLARKAPEPEAAPIPSEPPTKVLPDIKHAVAEEALNAGLAGAKAAAEVSSAGLKQDPVRLLGSNVVAFPGRDTKAPIGGGNPAEDFARKGMLGENLPGENLPGEKPSGEYLSGENLPGENLTGDKLSGEYLSGENLPEYGNRLPQEDIRIVEEGEEDQRDPVGRIPVSQEPTVTPLNPVFCQEPSDFEEDEDTFEDLEDPYPHFMVQAYNSEDGKNLAVETLKKIHRERGTKSQIAKITGEKLNSRGLASSMPKLYGKDLLIEDACDMNEALLEELNRILEMDDSGMIVVLVDTPERILRLHREHPDLAGKFQCIGCEEATKVQKAQPVAPVPSPDKEYGAPAPINTDTDAGYQKQYTGDDQSYKKQDAADGQSYQKELDLDDFVQYACEYARDLDCIVEELGILALYAKAEDFLANGGILTEEKAEDMIDAAIEKAEHRSIGKLITGVFSSKYNKEGLLILKEVHFKD